MNKKIMSIASLLFSVAFLAIFVVIWSTSQSIMKQESEELNSIYRAEVPFDIGLFDNKTVSGSSILNIAEDIANSGYTQSTKLYFYDYNSGADTYDLIGSKSDYGNYEGFVSGTLKGRVRADSEYKTYIHYGINGSVDGIAIEG